jgi:ankyrin repeat protein
MTSSGRRPGDANAVIKASMAENALLSIMSGTSSAGKDAMLNAAEKGDLDALRQLLDNGVDPDQCKGLNNFSPLHHAANRGHSLAVRCLLEANCGANLRNTNDETALHLAAYGGDLTVVELLIDKGAELDAANEDGETPLFFAARRGHTALIRLLLSRGSDAR